MPLVFDIVLPFFGIVVAGYVIARIGLFPAQANSGLSRFVYTFAIPIALFRSIARAELPAQVPWALLVAYFGSALAICVLGALAGKYLFRRAADEQALLGMGASYSNNVFLGIPLALTAFGDAAALPLFVIIGVHATIFFTGISVWIEGARTAGRTSIAAAPAILARSFIQNPILVGLALGLFCNLAGMALPKPVDDFTRLFGQAAIPSALFSLGASLAVYRIAGSIGETAMMVGLKLLVFPVLAWALAVPILGLPPVWAKVTILLAALPTGVNAYVFAARYRVAEEPMASAIFLSTALSFVTLTVLLSWLG